MRRDGRISNRSPLLDYLGVSPSLARRGGEAQGSSRSPGRILSISLLWPPQSHPIQSSGLRRVGSPGTRFVNRTGGAKHRIGKEGVTENTLPDSLDEVGIPCEVPTGIAVWEEHRRLTTAVSKGQPHGVGEEAVRTDEPVYVDVGSHPRSQLGWRKKAEAGTVAGLAPSPRRGRGGISYKPLPMRLFGVNAGLRGRNSTIRSQRADTRYHLSLWPRPL